MELLQSAVVPQIIVILGMLNVLTGAAIFFSCRCIPGARLMGKLMNTAAIRVSTGITATSGASSGHRSLSIHYWRCYFSAFLFDCFSAPVIVSPDAYFRRKSGDVNL